MNEEFQDASDSDEYDPAFQAELRELAESEAEVRAHIRVPYGKENVILVALQDRVVLRVKDRLGSNRAGLLHIPEAYLGHKLNVGEVLAVGPGAIRKKDGVRVPLTLQTGDEVIYHEFGGEEFQFGVSGEYKYRVIRERDCLALLTEGSQPAP